MDKQSLWNRDRLIELFTIINTAQELSGAPVYIHMSKADDSPFEILISTILSLRTRDEVTGPASIRLFEIANIPERMIQLSNEEIQKIIFPVGFYKTKAKQIIEISKILIREYDSKVPADLDLLLSFPGVGRKTANLVMSVAFNTPAVCVDVHVHRISNRLGICNTKDPEETEFYIRDNISSDIWNEFNRPMVALGQVICRPISPQCIRCPVENFCDKNIIKKIKNN